MVLDPSPDAELTYRVIGLAMRVHRRLGPGLLESAYHQCLCHELARAEIPFSQHTRLPMRYDDIGSAYFADIIVDGQVILELKAWSTSPGCMRQRA
jgi:GxxExxY protein